MKVRYIKRRRMPSLLASSRTPKNKFVSMYKNYRHPVIDKIFNRRPLPTGPAVFVNANWEPAAHEQKVSRLCIMPNRWLADNNLLDISEVMKAEISRRMLDTLGASAIKAMIGDGKPNRYGVAYDVDAMTTAVNKVKNNIAC